MAYFCEKHAELPTAKAVASVSRRSRAPSAKTTSKTKHIGESFNKKRNGVSGVQVVEHPDAIRTVLVRWNGIKIDLTKLARLRWIEKKKSHELCQIFGLRRTAVNRSIRTLRNAGILKLNLTNQEKKLIESQIKLENKIYGKGSL